MLRQTFTEIEGKFENLSIYIKKIVVIHFVEEIEPGIAVYTGLSNVKEWLNWYYFENVGEAVGDIFLELRNQNPEDNSLLWTSFELVVRAKHEHDRASIFAKTIQYLFEVLKQKCAQREINDHKGNEFIVPFFGYSKEHFANHF